MSQNTPNSGHAEFVPPVSAFTGPIAELVGHGMLSPPSRPGLLATLERYEIVRILGGGGMGLVLLGRDSETGKDVAIKMVKPDLVADRQVTHLFVKEAGHLQKLRHANLMQVLDVSDREQGPYFVMPYFEKGSLAKRIQPGQPLDTDTILEIATQIAEGLQFAHRRGIIHRDLKPANILLAANGKACLADFGLARTMFNDTIVDVERQQAEGTAPYMSPAVAEGNAEDTRCDIYAFGALLYEMLTGEPPYKGETAKEIRRQIIAGPPQSITALNPGADPWLVAVAESAMGRELRERYADMADVLADLQRVKDGKPPVGPHGIAGKMRGQLERVGNLPGGVWVILGAAVLVFVGWLIWKSGERTGERKPMVTSGVYQESRATKVTPSQAVGVSSNTARVVAATNPAPGVDTNNSIPISANGTASFKTLAGRAGVNGSVDAVGTNATFNVPSAVALDGQGNIFVVDTGNNLIRKITPDGSVTTLAGKSGSSGSVDGYATDARFLAPFGIAADTVGNVYVADTMNSTIRKITADGTVSTLAGLAKNPGSNDGTGSSARFRNPWNLAVDGAGIVYVADSSNNTIRKIAPDGKTTTLAGSAGAAGSADGVGAKARFSNPQGVAVDNAGNIFVADTGNDTVRKIRADGTVTTLAGFPAMQGNADGAGAKARFYSPQGLALDSAGNVYVADTDNATIRKITPTGMVTTLADASARLSRPGGVAVDGAGNLYVADTGNQIIRKGTTSASY